MKKHKELSKRLDKIEKHLQLNTEVSVIKNELTKLPEKWCVKVDVYNRKYLQKWIGNIELSYGMYILSDEKTSYSLIKKRSYTEITFDQFKKWVLKEVEHKLCDNYLFSCDECYSKFKDSKNGEISTIKKTALSNTDTGLSIREVQVKVTSQEEANECAEIAKACGEKVLQQLMSVDSNDLYFSISGDYFGCYKHHNSQTEISIQEYRERFGKPKEIDWSKAGQLVTNGQYSWITTGNNTIEKFEAILISKPQYDKYNYIGRKSNNCHKNTFKLCTEPITLKNE